MGSAYVRVAIAATAWGTWSLFLRPASIDPRWASAIMLAVVALASAPTLLRNGARGPSEGPPRRPSEWWAIVGLGVFDAANAALFFSAMAVTSVAVAVLSHYLAPVFVAAVAPSVLGTPRARRALPLTALALLGLALVLEPWKVGSSIGKPVLGAMLGAGSAVFYATNVLITKRVGPRFTAEEQLVYHAVLSAVLLAIVAVVVRAPLPTLRGAALVATASVCIGAVAGLLFLQGLKRIRAEHAGMLTFLEPLTAVVVAWLAWGERPGFSAAIGGTLVLGAGVFSLRAPST
ncbi:MAG: DMT family transporter [Deltaproteobacteria bacterium]|nr:DMT family transporter [Deltaproteobacteria bacterium]